MAETMSKEIQEGLTKRIDKLRIIGGAGFLFAGYLALSLDTSHPLLWVSVGTLWAVAFSVVIPILMAIKDSECKVDFKGDNVNGC